MTATPTDRRMWQHLTMEDRSIVAGSWRRGMANGGGTGLLLMATLWHENVEAWRHAKRALGQPESWRATVTQQTDATT